MKHENLSRWFESATTQYADNTAITLLRDGCVETELSYAQLWHDVGRFADILHDFSVEKGDRVILFIPKSLFAVVAHFAVLAVGAIAVPLNPGFKKDEMAYLLGDADAKLVIVEPGQKDLILEIDPNAQLLEIATETSYRDIDLFRSGAAVVPDVNIRSDDPGLIIYTSGTTGNPKGAVLTHGNLVCDTRNIIDIWKITSADVLCHALPLFHIHGLCFALHTALLSGAHVRMLDRFSPETVVTEMSRTNGGNACTVFMAVPAIYTKLMDFIGDRQLDFSHMRLLASGSAPLPIKEFDRITRIFGIEPVEREGMSETGMNFSNPLSGKRVPGSIGLPLPGVTVRIVDPEKHADVDRGEVGEIWLKSDAIAGKYWRKPRETADAFNDGWFRTGDLGRIDADGYYYLTDRIKHIIITGGENVSAKEVENVVNQIQGIDESAVVGVPDEKWGEKVVAAVRLEPDAVLTTAEITAHCRTKLHDWKSPKDILFLEEIPRNTMGKVLKEAVKRLFMS